MVRRKLNIFNKLQKGNKKNTVKEKKLVEKKRAKRPVIEKDYFSENLKTVKKIYDKSTGLKAMAVTLKNAKKINNPNQIQNECKKTFLAVKDGIQKKYGAKFEIVEYGSIQSQTNTPGNYATYNQYTNTFLFERIPFKGNPDYPDYLHLLKELRHEYGAFLLIKEYGSKENIPKIGNLWATHVLDSIND